ncbi:SIMPL domain-containing protein [Shewanella intestini]|uniref:SIMPL domain-containing protein n=1 Tax=Shewanella intestini TaxID=2017544 RepID=A0ABS5I580_9GAMM|nr:MULTISPECIES: SIMPL domain-containing protein [Shewanella]MBR9728530.1 SIMPL domain-containing protein [Shewanella intestini]MRG36349.1 DUF541 domain-containing protein [Shewanella sp. XMDDZSB0408]
MSRTIGYFSFSVNLCLLCALMLNPVHAVVPSFAHLETRGYSKIVTHADMAIINVAVISDAKTAQQAKTLSDNAVASLINKLTQAKTSADKRSAPKSPQAKNTQAKINMADIHTANLTLQPQYDRQKNQPRTLVGYQATRQVSVTVRQLSQLNDILDNAIINGINRINYIEYQTSQAVKIKQQARQRAIKDAQQKAKDLAEGFNTEIQGVWRIRYQDHQVHPVRQQMRAMALEDSISQSYQQHDVTITDNVDVTFRLK